MSTSKKQKKMKRLRYIPLYIILLVSFSSCSDYLEKAPGVDVTEDTIFSSKLQLETFVAGTYYWGLLSDLPMWDARDKRDCFSGAATDECEAANTWYWAQGWNTASLTASDNRDSRWTTHWKAIRRTNTIIDLIDNAPFDDPNYKKQVRGEAKFLRAYNYWQLFIKYGGVPILRHRFDLDDNFYVPRGTIDDVVKFMVQDCDDAYTDLPSASEYPSNLRGRASKAAALALKSRILLYAASPTFNTATPYMDFGGNNALICYGNKDDKRWEAAAEASRLAIQEAINSGFSLIKDKGVDKNYQYVWETPDNSEIILAEKSKEAMGPWHFPWGPRIPNTGASGFGPGSSLTYNFLKKYETKNGTQQTWDDNGGNDLMAKLKELDPRFAQSVAYQGQKWDNNDLLVLDFTSKDPNDPNDKDGRNNCIGGALVHKPVPYSVSSVQSVVPNGIILRLGELYLNYAEALNECHSTPPTEAYDAVDEIRARSGMPPFPRNLSQAEFRERIRNERSIELAFEGHRLWDIRRWEIAEQEGVMQGNMYGIKIYKIAGVSDEYTYKPYVFEVRSFKTRMYRHPFPQSEMDKLYLIQNPGYE